MTRAKTGWRRAGLAMLAAAFTALALGACSSTPGQPAQATAGDCVDVRLWSNGFHTNLAFSADLLDRNHPVRALFPEAHYFLIGWGERDYYIDPDPGALDALRAAFWPTPSAMQVIAHGSPVEETIWPGSDLVEFGLSEAGAIQLAEGLANALTLDEGGRPIPLAQGRIEGASVFLAAERDFHLFYMCNHWMAARLREAGAPVAAAPSFTAGGLMAAVRAKAAPRCNALDPGIP